MKVSNLGGAAAELPESAECFSAKAVDRAEATSHWSECLLPSKAERMI